jgi:hypothetical protein
MVTAFLFPTRHTFETTICLNNGMTYGRCQYITGSFGFEDYSHLGKDYRGKGAEEYG